MQPLHLPQLAATDMGAGQARRKRQTVEDANATNLASFFTRHDAKFFRLLRLSADDK